MIAFIDQVFKTLTTIFLRIKMVAQHYPQPQHFSPVPKLMYGRQWIPSCLSMISLDEGTQLDFLENNQKIENYAESMLSHSWDWESDYCSPIVLLFDKAETKLWCGDGHCRIKAARKVGKEFNSPQPIFVQIRQGNFNEAKFYYCLSNLRHSELNRRSKRKLIFELIANIHSLPTCDDRRLWSDREIARQIGNVDHKTIATIRREVVEAMNPGERFYRSVRLTEQQKSYRRNIRRLAKILSEVDGGDITMMLEAFLPSYREKLINGVTNYQAKFTPI